MLLRDDMFAFALSVIFMLLCRSTCLLFTKQPHQPSRTLPTLCHRRASGACSQRMESEASATARLLATVELVEMILLTLPLRDLLLARQVSEP